MSHTPNAGDLVAVIIKKIYDWWIDCCKAGRRVYIKAIDGVGATWEHVRAVSSHHQSELSIRSGVQESSRYVTDVALQM